MSKYYSLFGKIKKLGINLPLIIIGAISLINSAQAARPSGPLIYAAKAVSSTDGYLIDLSKQKATISKNPTVASDGTFFYQVGTTFEIKNTSSTKGGVERIGNAYCNGGAIFNSGSGAQTSSYTSNSYHRVFMYMPVMPYTINGRKVYQLSYNTFLTIDLSKLPGMGLGWIRAYGPYCNEASRFDGGTRKMSDFYAHLPIEINIYIKKKNIDGVTVIPSTDFAGYTRAFSNFRNESEVFSRLPGFMAIQDVTAPMRLKGATIISPAECRTDIGGSLIINHGVLNAEKYESRIVKPINFSCDHAIPTPVEFELLYTKDNDSQQRLPLKVDGTNKTIYSKIQMIDAESGNKGQHFISKVGQYKQIQIESILKGENADGGNYSGTAVLIAAYP
ncbi:MAG TPA: hypothetical protein DEV59_14205 [Proteus sp.]|nr:hypothetical protein [Proteus sp. (in: enterobacteria)]